LAEGQACRSLKPGSRRDSRAPGKTGLERITIARNHFMVPGNRVNPLYINKIEQIHILQRNREAIPLKDDLP
jgi:hypothetical protein